MMIFPCILLLHLIEVLSILLHCIIYIALNLSSVIETQPNTESYFFSLSSKLFFFSLIERLKMKTELDFISNYRVSLLQQKKYSTNDVGVLDLFKTESGE